MHETNTLKVSGFMFVHLEYKAEAEKQTWSPAFSRKATELFNWHYKMSRNEYFQGRETANVNKSDSSEIAEWN